MLCLLSLVIISFGRANCDNLTPDGSFHTDQWNHLGIAKMNHGNYSEALTAFDNAIALDPSNARAWNNRGIALGEQGNYTEALNAFDKAIKINSTERVLRDN